MCSHREHFWIVPQYSNSYLGGEWSSWRQQNRYASWQCVWLLCQSFRWDHCNSTSVNDLCVSRIRFRTGWSNSSSTKHGKIGINGKREWLSRAGPRLFPCKSHDKSCCFIPIHVDYQESTVGHQAIFGLPNVSLHLSWCRWRTVEICLQRHSSNVTIACARVDSQMTCSAFKSVEDQRLLGHAFCSIGKFSDLFRFDDFHQFMTLLIYQMKFFELEHFTAMKWRHLLIVMPIVIANWMFLDELHDVFLTLVVDICEWYAIVRSRTFTEADFKRMDTLYQP